jgi:hypothetical protein
MRQGEPIRISLELEGSDGLIAGRVQVGPDERQFTGWTELVAAIEATRDGSLALGDASKGAGE